VQDQEVAEREKIEAAETNRVADIRRICGKRHSDIEARAISENWDATRTELEVLRADRPKVPAAHIVERTSGPLVLEAAILSHMGKLSLVDGRADSMEARKVLHIYIDRIEIDPGSKRGVLHLPSNSYGCFMLEFSTRGAHGDQRAGLLRGRGQSGLCAGHPFNEKL
jgi:hypothetical protein